jgi:hypothetical protein
MRKCILPPFRYFRENEVLKRNSQRRQSDCKGNEGTGHSVGK